MLRSMKCLASSIRKAARCCIRGKRSTSSTRPTIWNTIEQLWPARGLPRVTVPPRFIRNGKTQRSQQIHLHADRNAARLVRRWQRGGPRRLLADDAREPAAWAVLFCGCCSTKGSNDPTARSIVPAIKRPMASSVRIASARRASTPSKNCGRRFVISREAGNTFEIRKSLQFHQREPMPTHLAVAKTSSAS